MTTCRTCAVLVMRTGRINLLSCFAQKQQSWHSFGRVAAISAHWRDPAAFLNKQVTPTRVGRSSMCHTLAATALRWNTAASSVFTRKMSLSTVRNVTPGSRQYAMATASTTTARRFSPQLAMCARASAKASHARVPANGPLSRITAVITTAPINQTGCGRPRVRQSYTMPATIISSRIRLGTSPINKGGGGPSPGRMPGPPPVANIKKMRPIAA